MPVISLGLCAKFQKATVSFVLSINLSDHPHGTTRLLLDRFLWHLIFECVLKICRKNSGFIKIW